MSKEHKGGATYASLSREYGISAARVRQICIRMEMSLGDCENATRQRLIEKLRKVVARIAGYHGNWSALGEVPLDESASKVCCTDLRKARGVGRKTVEDAIDLLISSGVSLSCGCPQTPCENGASKRGRDTVSRLRERVLELEALLAEAES